MARSHSDQGLRISGTMLRFISIVVGVAAAYFLTIQSLKVELSAKAESAVVNAMDKKLSNFEVILREGVVGREQFYRFSKDIESRLTRIELLLSNSKGDNRGEQ